MIQATEGVSRNILNQKTLLPTVGFPMAEQIHSKQSPTKASLPYKADILNRVPKLVTKRYTIIIAERAKTRQCKIKKGPDFMYGKAFLF